MKAPVRVVGIAGCSGSGKTTLVRGLRERQGQGSVCVVSQDDYYLPVEKQAHDANGRINFDLPTSLDMEQLAADISALSAGRSVRRKEYTFNNPDAPVRWIEVEAAPLILVEGFFLLHHQGVRDLLHTKVFVEADEATLLQRRIARDARERGYGVEDVRYQWDNHVIPAYRDYLLPYRSLCDPIIGNDAEFDVTLDALHARIAVSEGAIAY